MTPFALRLAVDRHVAERSSDVAGGVLLRSARFSHSWDLNQVVLAPGAGADDVAAGIALAEATLDGAAHRRVTVPAPAPAAPVDAPPGWEADELLLMTFGGGEVPSWPEDVLEVDAADLHTARLDMWRSTTDADAVAQELADMQLAFASYPGARALGVRREGAFVAWAQVAEGCIDDVYVTPPLRGQGLGRAITRAAVAAGGWFLFTDVGDPRPQALYRSLGFEEAGRLVQLTRHV